MWLDSLVVVGDFFVGDAKTVGVTGKTVEVGDFFVGGAKTVGVTGRTVDVGNIVVSVGESDRIVTGIAVGSGLVGIKRLCQHATHKIINKPGKPKS